MQHLVLGFVELHELFTLDGIPPLQHAGHTTQLGVIRKPDEGALSATVHAADKDVEQC